MKKLAFCVIALAIFGLMLTPTFASDQGKSNWKCDGKGCGGDKGCDGKSCDKKDCDKRGCGKAGKGCGKPRRGPHRGGPRVHMLAKLLGLTMEELKNEFDADADDKLSEEETKAMHESLKERMLEKYDADGDGELSEEEKKQIHEDIKELHKDAPKDAPPRRGKGRHGKRGGCDKK